MFGYKKRQSPAMFPVLVSIGLFASFLCNIALANPEPGLWRVTIGVEMNGAADLAPKQRVEYCVKRIQSLPQLTLPTKSCKIKKLKLGFNTLRWDSICPRSNGESSGSGNIQFENNKFEGKAHYLTKVNGSHSSFPMRQTISGIRLGNCQ